MSVPDVTETNLATETAQRLATVLRPLRTGNVPVALAAVKQVEGWIFTLTEPLTKARIFYQLAEMLYDAGLHDEAQQRFERSLVLNQTADDRLAHLGIGLCLQKLGAIHRDIAKLSEAIDCYRQSIEHFRIIKDFDRVGSTWNNLGIVHHHRGDLEAAEDSYRRALTLSEKVGDIRLRAISLGNLGKVALDHYRFTEAENQLRSAIELSRTLNSPLLLVSQLGELGNVLRAQGRSTEAIQCYEEALRLSEQDIRMQQISLSNLGALYWECGELSRALLYLKRSFAISQKLSDATNQVTDLLHLSRLYQELVEPERATECLRDALTLAEKASPHLLPGVLEGLGHLAMSEEDLDQADSYYRRCLTAEEKIGDIYNIGTSWLNLGYVAWQRGKIKQAFSCWHKALELHKAAGNRSGQTTAHLNLGSALGEQDDFVGAKVHLHAALKLAEIFPLPKDARLGWGNLGLVRWRQGDLTEARQAYDQAIAWAERSRLTVASHTHRVSYWPTLDNTYLGLIQLSLVIDDKRGAWKAVQMSRSRTLAELLGSSRLPIPDHLPIGLRQQEEELLARLRKIHRLFPSVLSPTEMAELVDCQVKLDVLWTEMKAVDEEYVAQRRGEPVTFEVVRNCL